jgi:DNA-directed RNA polymerase specialized sigma24 family protein
VAAALDLRAALAALPPRQRATIVLRYYDELSIQETAEALQCSVGTVKSQTARALASLRRTLDESEDAAEFTAIGTPGAAGPVGAVALRTPRMEGIKP